MSDTIAPRFELTGVQKAAVLLMQMDRDRSASVSASPRTLRLWRVLEPVFEM